MNSERVSINNINFIELINDILKDKSCMYAIEYKNEKWNFNDHMTLTLIG